MAPRRSSPAPSDDYLDYDLHSDLSDDDIDNNSRQKSGAGGGRSKPVKKRGDYGQSLGAKGRANGKDKDVSLPLFIPLGNYGAREVTPIDS